MATLQYNDEKTKLLLELCKKGCKAELGQFEELLNNGADPNGRDDLFGNTPLILASEHGNKEVVELLLRHNADVHMKNKWRPNILHLSGRRSDDKDAVSKFLNSSAKKDKGGWSAVSAACENGHFSVYKLLQQHGANVNKKDLSILLSRLCKDGCEAKLGQFEDLLNNGADPNGGDEYGIIPLLWASEYGNKEVVELLLNHEADVKKTYSGGWSAVSAACENGHFSAYKLLQQHGANVNKKDLTKLLLKLCLNGCEAEPGQFEDLLNNGADPDSCDQVYGRTLLMWASEYGNKEVVELLLYHKADVKKTDGLMRTALHRACERGRLDIASKLLRHGASIHKKDITGKTPLELARDGAHSDVVILLETAELKSDPDAKTIAMLFKIPFKDVVSSLTTDDYLGWHCLMVCDMEAKFRVKQAFDISLSYYNQSMAYLEIRVSKVGDSACFLQDAYVHVRETVEKKLADIGGKDGYSLAFFCTCSQTSTQHMMKVEMPTPLPPKQAVCNYYKPLNQDLSEGIHLDWFAPCYENFHSIKKGLLTLNFTPVPNLQRKGEKMQLISANIEEVVKVDCTQATIKDRTVEEKVTEHSQLFNNNSENPIEETWSYVSSFLSVEERSKTKRKGWNVGGEFKPTVSTGGVSVGIGGPSASYSQHTEKREATIHHEGSERRQQKKFTVSANSTTTAKIEEITREGEGTVENVSITFNPKAMVKCKVVKDSYSDRKGRSKQYELRDLFYLNDQSIPDKNETLQRSVSASYDWTENTSEFTLNGRPIT